MVEGTCTVVATTSTGLGASTTTTTIQQPPQTTTVTAAATHISSSTAQQATRAKATPKSSSSLPTAGAGGRCGVNCARSAAGGSSSTSSAAVVAEGKRYGVRAAEVALHRALSVIRVEVILLDDSPHVFEIQKRAKGQSLLDLVFGHLELLERDYFGLQYRDTHAQDAAGDKRWLDPLKMVKKQLRLHSRTIDTCQLPVLYFRVKFWVSEPGRLTEEYTRYHVVLQLRRLLTDGILPAPPTTAALLASYALQSDFGDYNAIEHGTHYLHEAELMPPMPLNMRLKLIELHKLHKGQTPADAEFQFLDHAKRIELYGVDIHSAKDSSERDLSLGVTSTGLVVIRNGVKMNTFSWAKIVKISFKRRHFMIQLRREDCESYESVLVFTLPSYRGCKCLWKSCVEHHTFFRLHTPRPPPKRQLLALGSKFWYSGRTQHQTLEDTLRILASSTTAAKTFVRSPSKQASLATLGTTNGAGTNNTGTCSSGTTSKRSMTVGGLRPRSDSVGYRVNSLPATPKLAWADNEEEKSAGPSAINGNGESAGLNGSFGSSKDDLPSSGGFYPSTSLSGRPSTPANIPSTTTLSIHPSSTPPSTSKASVSFSSKPSSKISSKETSRDLSKDSPSLPQSRDSSKLSSKSSSKISSKASSKVSSKASSRAVSEVPLDSIPVTVLAPLATHEAEADLNSSSGSSKSSSSSSSSSSSTTSVCDALQGGGSEESEHGLITIRIQPASTGRFAGKFGFNVKGGADQDAPVLVSKVTAGSPADTCYPRLNEGDQVLLINGREVSDMTHAQVVNSIKASRECHSGDLVLTVRQNVYEGDVSDEPAFRYVPVSVQQLSTIGTALSPPASGATAAISPQQLKESVLLLQDGLLSGLLVAQFESLCRRKLGLTFDMARLSRNENRNRYRDISPYDSTRVKLQPPTPSPPLSSTIPEASTTTTTTISPTTTTNGSSTNAVVDSTTTSNAIAATDSIGAATATVGFNDYINASHVVMEIPGSNIINRYIASQGPLHATCSHFWQMVWEQKCYLLVMLTTCIEQGRSKCHQYWPELHSSAEYGPLTVSCDQQKLKPGFAFRELTVTHKQSGVKRKLQHLQYLAWPDHGVPEHSTDFLDFVKQVRQLRAEESEQPILVHCSAGIGRTGVLILMETAQCLIEARQPLYPTDLVDKMRDQRAMMIQTSGQFRFVCKAINRVYTEKLVQPLPQYSNR